MSRAGLVALVVLAGCGGAPAREVVVEVPCPEAAPPPVGDSEVDLVVDAAARALGEGHRADAAVLVAALATLDPDRASAVGIATLAGESLPHVVALAGTHALRSSDGRWVVRRRHEADEVAFRTGATTERPACGPLVLERYDLERVARQDVPVAQEPESTRLARLLGLEPASGVDVVRLTEPCAWPGPTSEPSSTTLSTDPERALPVVATVGQSCGMLERVSSHGRFAIVTSPVELPASTPCTPPATILSTSGSLRECIAPVARLVDLASGAITDLGLVRSVVFSPDERWALVRGVGVALYAIAEDGPPVVRQLPTECGGPIAFAADGSALATTCRDRVEVRDLATPDAPARTIALDDPFLRPLSAPASTAGVLALAVGEHGSTTVVVLRLPPETRFVVADEHGVLTHRIGAEELDVHVRATTSRHVVSDDAAVVPHIHVDYGWSPDAEGYLGQALEREPAALGWIVGGHVGLLGADDHTQLWRSLRVPRGRRLVPTWELDPRTMVGAGALLEVRPATDVRAAVWVFEHARFSPSFEQTWRVPADHSAGPTLWEHPPRADGVVDDDEPADGAPPTPSARDLATDVLSRTNLRPCRDSLRVVPVVPAPAADAPWAPEQACALPPAEAADRQLHCPGYL